MVSAARRMPSLSPTAVREDRDGRFREEATFHEHRGERIFTVTHIPAQAATEVGLVICSSILVEHLTNYRREVLLARHLAAGGMATQRFHYRGTGHSTGDESQATLASMVDDALAAADRLQVRPGVSRVAFMGTRFGALAAAQAARARAGGLLVFWEPVLDADRYFRELIRARLVHELKDGRPSRGSPDAWKAEMARQGLVEILGYPLYRDLYESARGAGLQARLPNTVPAALIVQMGGGSTVRPASEQLRVWISERGGTVQIEVVPEDPVWLFVGQRTMNAVDAPVRITATWLVDEVARA